MKKTLRFLALAFGAAMMTLVPARAEVSNTYGSAYWSIYMYYDQSSTIWVQACSTWPQGQTSATTGAALTNTEIVLLEEVGSPWPAQLDVNVPGGLTANADGSMNCATFPAPADTSGGDPIYDLRLYNFWGQNASNMQIIELQSGLYEMGTGSSYPCSDPCF